MNKPRIGILFIILFICFSSNSYCEDYLQRFIRADLLGKIDILHEASVNADLDSVLPYEYALQFVLDNYAQIDDLRDMNRITSISISSLLKHGRVLSIDALNTLWKLFLEYPNVQTKTEIVISLGVLGKWNRFIIDNLNNYLTETNQLFKNGHHVDYSIISACISAIMELGDSSSYPVLFEIICSDYPEVITSEAFGALEIIPGNLHQFLFNVIENNVPQEKYDAFKVVVNNERLSIPERGQLAELALAQSLLAVEENADLNAMRYAAVIVLSRLRWTRANALAIRHYYRVQADYSHDIVPKERFLEAITCLGAVGNSDAALVLGLQQGLINVRMFSTGSFDAEVTLAIVQSLGLIGDNAVFDHLLRVINLPYPDYIIAAAREAVDRLKW
ncbi:MAG: hypothetical protein FWD26_05175 [Treponema sp.]|nr:hypothetical protein [Treponema sp.]